MNVLLSGGRWALDDELNGGLVSPTTIAVAIYGGPCQV